ncbi:copper resistance protein CopC [Streptomyces sp. BPTC-684]|uniref:copper resistance protein CopC n=1 Tax=Streptomyces sp. BPTC-684 TaxID=3043734 RepID=UPI0024B1441A|nr:copper resistance protein CopC [Streptomyces sp. BPTC-684]WHM37677.1 copper resistance protein CopC [Streptomyces sp. BPTC-684]
MTATAPRFGTALARLLLVAAALLGAVFATASPASAHAAVTATNPKDGAVVASAPKDVDLTFSEQVAMDDKSIRVLDPNGKRADTGELLNLCSGSIVKYGVSLRDGLPKGTYTVAWQAVSADSHPVAGAFTFSIGAPSKTTVSLSAPDVGGGLVGALYDTMRYAAYAGFILFTGGGAFVLACWQRGASVRPVQRLVVGGWLTMTAATIALLLLRTPYTGSGELADAFDLDGLKAVLQTKSGAALSSRLLLLSAAALFISVLFGAYAKRENEEKKDLTYGLAIGGFVVAAGIAATWALAEHASTGIQTALAMPVAVVHLLSVATWLGGLATLLVALHLTPSVERAAVRRFSRIAFWSVAVLASTGVYQAWRQVGSWSALTGTGYGQILLVKVGLIAVLLSAAYISRRWTGQLSEHAAPEAEAASIVERRAAEPELSEEPEPVTVPDDAKSPADRKRAQQLARQQAAMTIAREKRIRDADPQRSGLRRSVLTEAGVAVAVLAVATILSSTEPGRTQEAAAAAQSTTQVAVPDRPISIRIPFDTGGKNGKGTVRLTLDPGRTGANEMHVWTDDAAAKPLDAPEVKVAFTLTAKAIGPLPVAPERITRGHWSATGVQLPMPGDWQVSVTVRTSDIDQVTVDKNIKIG